MISFRLSNLILFSHFELIFFLLFLRWMKTNWKYKENKKTAKQIENKIQSHVSFEIWWFVIVSHFIVLLSYLCGFFLSLSSLLIATCVHHRPIFNCWWDIRYNSSSFIAWEMCNLTFFQKPFHAYYFRYLLRWNESVKLLVESSVWTYGSKYAMR